MIAIKEMFDNIIQLLAILNNISDPNLFSLAIIGQ